jgi:uncharacterized protein DUF3352
MDESEHPTQPDDVLHQNIYADPGTHEPQLSRAKVAVLLLAIVVAITSAGTVLALRAANSEQPLASLVPQNVAGFVRIALRPSGDQRSALRALVGHLPSNIQANIGSRIDGLLDQALKDVGLSFRKDVKPWIGGQLGFAALAPGPKGETAFIGLLAVRDSKAARAALQKVVGRKDAPRAFDVVGGVAYLADKADQITTFRNAVSKGHALSDLASYKRALGKVGGEGLIFGYVDSRKLVGIPGALPGDLLPIPGLNVGSGIAAFSLRAQADGLVITGRAPLATGSVGKPGKPALLESAPSDLLGSLTMFDFGDAALNALKVFEGLGATSTLTSTDSVDMGPAIGAVERALGLNFQKDVLPWLRGEVSVVVGNVTEPPFPNIGILIQPTDRAAAARTITALSTHLGSLIHVPIRHEANGFTIDLPEGLPQIVVRSTSNRVVIATGRDYAQRLLSAAHPGLGEDLVYRRTIGESKPTAFQLYARLDRIRPLIEGFAKLADPSAYADYERNVQPLLVPFQALGMRAFVDGNETQFSIRLMLTP